MKNTTIFEVRIKKFRQLEDVHIFPFGLVNEVYGSNGCGKTSLISFITWMLYGETIDYGKNDDKNIDSYKPEELISGEIDLIGADEEDMVKIGREYGYDEKGRKVQKFYINGRKVAKQDEYYNKIKECFGLGKLADLKIKSFNLLRALSDPYYLPNNEDGFRELISALLDFDSNDILFGEGNEHNYLEIKKEYEEQDSDYDKCKDYFNQKIKEYDTKLIKINALIDNLKGLNYSEEEYQNALKELDVARSYTINANEDLLVKTKMLAEAQTNLAESQKLDALKPYVSENKKKLNVLRAEYNEAYEEWHTKNVNNNIAECDKKSYTGAIESYEKQLDELRATKFKEIYCPNCKTLINEDDYKTFNKNKIERSKAIKNEIERSKKELAKLVIYDLTDLKNKLSDLDNQIKALNDIVKEEPTFIVSDETKRLQAKIETLTAEIQKIKEADEERIIQIKKEAEEKIEIAKEKVRECENKKTQMAHLDEYKKEKAEIINTQGKYEIKMTLLKQFKLDEIKLIKQKTSEIFGNDFEFEMLVKNRTNDNYKKVCYASINGLEHDRSNTAKYLKYSIMILERLKNYIGGCTMPIIFDIADNIGKSARTSIFNTIEKSQIFYTRIADNDGVERQLNVVKDLD